MDADPLQGPQQDQKIAPSLVMPGVMGISTKTCLWQSKNSLRETCEAGQAKSYGYFFSEIEAALPVGSCSFERPCTAASDRKKVSKNEFTKAPSMGASVLWAEEIRAEDGRISWITSGHHWNLILKLRNRVIVLLRNQGVTGQPSDHLSRATQSGIFFDGTGRCARGTTKLPTLLYSDVVFACHFDLQKRKKQA